MTLRTGNKRFGFTLIELMIATVVLSLGVVMIYEAYFLSLYTFNYCYDYLNIVSWADEQIWQAQDDLSRLGALSQPEVSGEFRKNNKDFKWDLSYASMGGACGLYSVDLAINWHEGAKTRRLTRTAFALRYEEKK